MPPPPTPRVRYNDWPRVAATLPERFRPAFPVSVVVPYFEAPQALALTLAALERQTWPRELLEVVIVDDGSRTPLRSPRSPLSITVVRQERRGFGLARARNAGARAAAHDILLFLDGDMLPEAEWIAAHARWHHAVADVLTLGFRAHVDVEGIDAAAIRNRTGSLDALFAGRPTDASFAERHMARTRELTTKADDLFRVMVGANFGIRRELYDAAGAFDESFTRWGGEDTEFAYRVFTFGSLLVPVREAFAWHQGRYMEDRKRKNELLRLQRPKLAHLVAHHEFRDARRGRLFAVPQYVVTADVANLREGRVLELVERVLASRIHDLVLRIEVPPHDRRLAWLQEQFDPDPRVRVGNLRPAIDDFPAASFHVAIPGRAVFGADLLSRMRHELGNAAMAKTTLPGEGGGEASIARAWALHRAKRTGASVAAFGDVLTIPARRLRIDLALHLGAGDARHRGRLRRLRVRAQQVRMKMGRLRTARQARWFLEWLGGVIRWRLAKFAWVRRRIAPPPTETTLLREADNGGDRASSTAG